MKRHDQYFLFRIKRFKQTDHPEQINLSQERLFAGKHLFST